MNVDYYEKMQNYKVLEEVINCKIFSFWYQ